MDSFTILTQTYLQNCIFSSSLGPDGMPKFGRLQAHEKGTDAST
jgi:hypothetical protein